MALFERSTIKRLRDRGDAAGLVELLTHDVQSKHVSIPMLTAIEDALVTMGDPGIDALARAVRSPDPQVRTVVADRLRREKNPHGIPALATALDDSDAGVRAAAADALAYVDDPYAVEALVGHLDDDSPEVRRRAAFALAERGDNRALSELARIAQHDPLLVAQQMICWLYAAERAMPPGRGAWLDRPTAPSDVAALLRSLLAEVPGLATVLRSASVSGFPDQQGPHVLEVVGGPEAGAALALPGTTVWLETMPEVERFTTELRGPHGGAALGRLLARQADAESAAFLRAVLDAPAGSSISASPPEYASGRGGWHVRLTLEAPPPVAARPARAPLAEEFAGYRQALREETALLAALTPLAEDPALAVFAGLGIEQPNRYPDARSAFSGLRQYGMGSEDAPVRIHRLQLAGTPEGADFLLVHLVDPALPLAFLVCALTDGRVLGYYETGDDLPRALGL